ncbi:hypothetical protein CVT25_004776 [Psilocybe cyanescens]|uniref:Uncharacterized protein n=1 Tax=Psilocybe cyanescens TaxID=93625 RepID=A0A409W9Z5_PSICY|nr:hypothetical protein CVT25_004776 [Psilocybe cyanescens]
MFKVKRKADDKSTSEEMRINKRRCMDGSLLVPRAKGCPTPLEHPQILYDTKAHIMTPISFYLNKNFQTITEEAATLPMVKANPLPGESKSMYILDVGKLTDRFGSDGTLTCSQWMEAAENNFRFQQKRDKDGDKGLHSRWYKHHFGFFSEQIK